MSPSDLTPEQMKGVHGAHPACVPMRPWVPWLGALLLAEPIYGPAGGCAQQSHRWSGAGTSLPAVGGLALRPLHPEGRPAPPRLSQCHTQVLAKTESQRAPPACVCPRPFVRRSPGVRVFAGLLRALLKPCGQCSVSWGASPHLPECPPWPVCGAVCPHACLCLCDHLCTSRAGCHHFL